MSSGVEPSVCQLGQAAGTIPAGASTTLQYASNFKDERFFANINAWDEQFATVIIPISCPEGGAIECPAAETDAVEFSFDNICGDGATLTKTVTQPMDITAAPGDHICIFAEMDDGTQVLIAEVDNSAGTAAIVESSDGVASYEVGAVASGAGTCSVKIVTRLKAGDGVDSKIDVAAGTVRIVIE